MQLQRDPGVPVVMEAQLPTLNPVHASPEAAEAVGPNDLNLVLREGRSRAASAAAKAGFGFGEGTVVTVLWAFVGSAAVAWGGYFLATNPPGEPAAIAVSSGATFVLSGIAALLRAQAMWRGNTAYKFYSIPILCYTAACGVLASAVACLVHDQVLRCAYNAATAVVLFALGTLLVRGHKEWAQRLIYAILGAAALVLFVAGVVQLATGSLGTAVAALLFSALAASLLYMARQWHQRVLRRQDLKRAPQHGDLSG